MPPKLHPISALIDRDDVLRQIKHEFETADLCYGQRRSALWDRLTPLADQVDKLQEQDHAVDCSQQHRLEAQWLLNYMADWPRAEATLRDLATSLVDHDQRPLAQYSGGSWGPCCTEPYRKLEPTVGELQDPHLGSGVVLQPLAFMTKFQDIDWLVADLQRLQVSDIRRTKRNNRDGWARCRVRWPSCSSSHPFPPPSRLTPSCGSGYAANVRPAMGILRRQPGRRHRLLGADLHLRRAAQAGAGPFVHVPYRPFPQRQHPQPGAPASRRP